MDLREALLTAIKGEIEGRDLYKAAAEKTRDKKAKKVFTLLSDEEQSHLNSLVQIAKEYEEGKELSIPDLPSPASFEDAQSPIFTPEFKNKVADFDMSALSIGIKLELESEKFYRDVARQAESDTIRNLFERLADWEHGHYEYLQKQIGFFESYYTEKYSLFRF